MNGKTALGLDVNIGAMLCYVANIIPCVVPLGLVYSIIVVVQDKTNKLARFHAFQIYFLSPLHPSNLLYCRLRHRVCDRRRFGLPALYVRRWLTFVVAWQFHRVLFGKKGFSRRIVNYL